MKILVYKRVILSMYVLPLSQNDCPTSKIFFNPKMIVWFIRPARKLRLKVKYFCANNLYQEVFRHCNFCGCFRVVVVFYVRVILTTTRSMIDGP